MSRLPPSDAPELVQALRIPVARWMSGADALAYIVNVARCDWASAELLLRKAIADGRLSVRWVEDAAHIETPPACSFWKDASIRMNNGGEVLHQVFERRLVRYGEDLKVEDVEGTPVYRTFLVRRSELESLWPLGAAINEATPVEEKSFVRPKAADIRKAATRLFEVRRSDPPNINEAAHLICAELPGATRDAVREVLREPEFQKLRRRPGVHRKR